MTDILIRDVPADVIAAVEAKCQARGTIAQRVPAPAADSRRDPHH